jgi:uncharacterized membrane-anchored protein/uncharacterized membrane protein
MNDSVAQQGANPDINNIAIEPYKIERAIGFIAPLLIGLGVIFWLAANWDGFGRYGRFGFAGGALGIALLGALFVEKARAGFLLMAFLSAGGLFALIGQTYQTGADPWSLFALWAVLTLPFSLAARSDAVWTGWIIVALAGVTLWAHNTSSGLFDSKVASATTIISWIIAVALCAFLSPASPLSRILGRTIWAWRLGLLLTALLIVSLALSDLFGRSEGATYLIGLAIIGVIMLLVLITKPFDILAAAIAGLSIDILLIAGVARVFFNSADGFLISTLIVGLASAGIVAATATFLLSKFRKNRPNDRVAQSVTQSDNETPWPVILLTAVGALIAAIPLLLFFAFLIVMLFGESYLSRGMMIYIVGGITFGGALILLRSFKYSRFFEIFALVFLFAGALQIGFGAFRDLGIATASSLLALGCFGLAILQPQRWIALLMGVLAASLVTIALQTYLFGFWILEAKAGSSIITGIPRRLLMLQFMEAIMLAIALAVLVFKPKADPKIHVFASGWIAGTLLRLASQSGATFLSGAFLPISGGQLLGIQASGGYIAIACALLGLTWFFMRQNDSRKPVIFGAAAVTMVLSLLQPFLATPVFTGSVMMAEGRRRLALLSGVIGLWILGGYYYSLSLPLTQKGLILIALGAGLGILALTMRSKITDGSVTTAPSNIAMSQNRFGIALIAAGGVAIAGLAGWSIFDKERILRDGRMVMLKIAPVDPRSLLQGDYMTLAFDLPERRASMHARQPAGPQPVAVGTVGSDQVVTLTRIVLKRPALAQGEIVIALSVKNGNYVVGSDAWFFKEGDGDRWTAARYGIFRVTSDGTALLAGLADETRQQIR